MLQEREYEPLGGGDTVPANVRIVAATNRILAEQVSEGVDLGGPHPIVTGASGGLGLETTRVLALRGAEVTMACRDLEKGNTALGRIVAESDGRIDSDALELERTRLLVDAEPHWCDERDATKVLVRGGRPVAITTRWPASTTVAIASTGQTRTHAKQDVHFSLIENLRLTSLLVRSRLRRESR